MATNVVPGAESFAFGSLALHGNLQVINDTDELDLALHRILKSDGVIDEPMGWNGRRFQAQVAFVGPNFRADAQRVRDAIHKNSRDTLVHPLFGRITARCNRIAGALNIPAEANSTTLTLDFVESGINPASVLQISQTVTAKSQALTASADDMTAAVAIYASVVDTASLLSSAADGFASDAVFASQQNIPNPSFDSQVIGIEAAALATIAAIQADPAATEDVDRFDAMTAADLVYAAALDLADALAAGRPAVVTYTVPSATSYLAVSCTLYGADGLARADEILANNPWLVDPNLIASGSVLTVSQPTV